MDCGRRHAMASGTIAAPATLGSRSRGRHDRLDLHDMKKRYRDEPVVDRFRRIRPCQPDRHGAMPHHRKLRMNHVIGPAIRQSQPEWLEGLVSKMFSNVLRSHGQSSRNLLAYSHRSNDGTELPPKSRPKPIQQHLAVLCEPILDYGNRSNAGVVTGDGTGDEHLPGTNLRQDIVDVAEPLQQARQDAGGVDRPTLG